MVPASRKDAGSKREFAKGAFIWPETGSMVMLSIWTVSCLMYVVRVL